MTEGPTPELRIANLRDLANDPDIGPLATAILLEAAEYLQKIRDEAAQ